MKEITIGLSSSPALKQLMRIINMGGKITKAPCEISIMLNGLRYYSMEVTLNNEFYNIQGFEEEAVILHKTAVILHAAK